MTSRQRNNPLSGRVNALSANEISQHVSQVDAAKFLLSGSTDGQPILLTGTSLGAVTTIHTSDLTALDEVWLYACNNDASIDRTLYLSFDSGTSLTTSISIPDNSGLVLVLPGFMITNGVSISAYASSASKISVFGWVNRYFTLEQRELLGDGWAGGGD